MCSANAQAIGIDLGGGTVRTGVYDAEWKLLGSITQKTRVSDGPQAVIGDMATAVRTLSLEFALAPKAIGLGSPGPLNLLEGRLLRLPNFPGWEFFPIRDALAEATGIPVVLESDANAAAFAEWRLGAGTIYPVDSMCMVTLGTGVGSGLIIQGRVWHGRNGMAGELGHVCLIPDGPVCPCGGRGCLERYASATAIADAGSAWLRAHEPESETAAKGSSLTTHHMANMANGGHQGMKKIFDLVGYTLGLSTANVINTLDLPLYVIGGGVADAWNLFSPALFDAVRDHSYVYRLSAPTQKIEPESGKPFITRAKLGPHAGLIGAAMVSLSATRSTARSP